MGVHYSQALAERAQAYQDRPLSDKRSPEGLAELAAIWSAIQGQPAGSCRQCQYSDFTHALVSYLRDFSRLQYPDLMSDSAYQLAPPFASETLVHEDYGRVVTADTLTDADVEFFTSKGRGDLFVKKSASTATAADSSASTDSTPSADETAPLAKLTKEQEAHAVTKAKAAETLAKEKEAHAADKTKAADALKAEKEAHKATKAELSEVQKQLATAQKQLADLADKATQAVDTTTPPSAATAAS